MIKKIYFLVFSVLLTFASCIKEPQKPSWDVSIVAPLFKTSLSIGNFLADSITDIDSTHQIHVVYNEVLYEYSPNTIIEVPDTITSQEYQSPLNATLQPGQLILNNAEQNLYKLGNTKLSFITIKNGLINFQVCNSVKEAILMTYTIPLAKKNGVSFEFTELIPAASDVPFVFSKEIDISGYSLDMRGTNGLGANLIGTQLKARLNPNGTATTITPQDYFIANIKFDQFILSYAKGYFGNTEINLDDESKINMFSSVKAGTFDLESISVAFDIVNGFGIDAQMVIDEISSVNSVSSQNVLLHTTVLGQSINVTRAVETGNSSVPVLSTTYPINLDNSNIKQMLENMPDKISFKITGSTNPMGNISGGNDFYYDGYGLKLMLHLDIPLSLKAHNLTLIDTVKFNFENTSDKNKITKGLFNLIADNGFPFDALLQLYMIDENNAIIDSLLFNNLVLAAPLGSDAIVSGVKRTVINAPVPAEKLDKLYLTKKMVTKLVFNTDNSQYLKLYDFYKIDLKLTGDFDFILQQ